MLLPAMDTWVEQRLSGPGAGILLGGGIGFGPVTQRTSGGEIVGSSVGIMGSGSGY